MWRCTECGAFSWTQTAMHEHFIKEHEIPTRMAPLKLSIMQGQISDWPQQAPTHTQIQTDDAYSHQLIPWQDEILAILWRSYDGGQAA